MLRHYVDGATVVDGVDEGSTILYVNVDIQPSFLYRLQSIMEELRTKL